MTTIITTVAGTDYTIRPQPVARAAHRVRSVLQARLLDELTGQGVRALGLRSTVRDLTSRVSTGGVAGLTGNPGRIFTELAAAPAEIDATFTAPGYLPRSVAATLGPINTGLGHPADFPDHFEPVDLGDLALHRQPVRISGRCVQEIGATRTPLAGVDVTLTGIWSSAPGPDDLPAPLIEPPDLVALSPGLYSDRPVVGTSVVERSLVLAPQAKRLLRPLGAGQRQARVSDRNGLIVGEALAIEPGDPAATEYIEIVAIAGGLTPDEAATITLAWPAARYHRTGSDVQPASPAPAGPAAVPLAREGLVGDPVLHTAALPLTLATGDTVEISSGGTREFQTVARYAAQTDAEGAYRLPPLGRVARARFEADRADFIAPLTAEIRPDYPSPAQPLDFVLRP